ncbi:MAG: hypothetical protein LBT92_03900 [Rickettsiales bacterium]|jgi:hypothetical protein|nr:hypothetical protein [Rickettsiales bacterium]
MKKAISIALALALAGCGSYRTTKGETHYSTLFGVSIESAVMGDGIYLPKK